MSNFPSRKPAFKKAKGRLLEWMDICHERALYRELEELDKHFSAWKAGELSTFGLEGKIHEFHQGPSRKLYGYFQIRSDMRIIRLVEAIRMGLVDLSELREDIRAQAEEILEKWKAFDEE